MLSSTLNWIEVWVLTGTLYHFQVLGFEPLKTKPCSCVVLAVCLDLLSCWTMTPCPSLKSLADWRFSSGLPYIWPHPSCAQAWLVYQSLLIKKTSTHGANCTMLHWGDGVLGWWEVVKYFKFFQGPVCDYKFTFIPHMKMLRKTCFKTINILKVLANRKWGADTTGLLQLYRTFN